MNPIIGLVASCVELAGLIYFICQNSVLKKRLAKYEKDGVPICNGENK